MFVLQSCIIHSVVSGAPVSKYSQPETLWPPGVPLRKYTPSIIKELDRIGYFIPSFHPVQARLHWYDLIYFYEVPSQGHTSMSESHCLPQTTYANELMP